MTNSVVRRLSSLLKTHLRDWYQQLEASHADALINDAEESLRLELGRISVQLHHQQKVIAPTLSALQDIEQQLASDRLAGDEPALRALIQQQLDLEAIIIERAPDYARLQQEEQEILQMITTLRAQNSGEAIPDPTTPHQQHLADIAALERQSNLEQRLTEVRERYAHLNTPPKS